VSIFNAWMASRKAEQIQGSLFEDYEQ
jgi:hypothetical protein